MTSKEMKQKRNYMEENMMEGKDLEKDVNAGAEEEAAKETESAAGNPEGKESGSAGSESDPKEERIAALEKELEQAKTRIEKDRNDYLRLMADLENLRRRSAEERINLIGTASEDIIKGLLPVLDDLERAMDILSKSSDEAAREGTTLIYSKLMAYLKSKGLEVIDAKGKKFDTDFHEAVSQFPVQDEAQKGIVFDVVSTGYMLGGKILRYAKVVVGN